MNDGPCGEVPPARRAAIPRGRDGLVKMLAIRRIQRYSFGAITRDAARRRLRPYGHEEAAMDQRVKLDVGSISVASFDTVQQERGRAAHLAAITRSTVNLCCDNTECVTRAECSTQTCA